MDAPGVVPCGASWGSPMGGSLTVHALPLKPALPSPSAHSQQQLILGHHSGSREWICVGLSLLDLILPTTPKGLGEVLSASENRRLMISIQESGWGTQGLEGHVGVWVLLHE